MAAESTANAVWEGDLAHGGGRVAPGSGAFEEQEVTWASRTSRSAGKTSPEELIAAAHAACYAMAFSHTLAEGGHTPERVEASAAVTFETEGGPRISSVALTVRGRVPGIEDSAFQEAANAAKDGCPVSGALKGNVDITVDATLES
ncbi:MAG TPA: OsmC family peroxiredoxin [Thermoleophilaceae bacterium]|nr:OsmC family peroxiredoxin [Thermoleophilaceae bacterium]